VHAPGVGVAKRRGALAGGGGRRHAQPAAAQVRNAYKSDAELMYPRGFECLIYLFTIRSVPIQTVRQSPYPP
jgi:hypothetical protein